MNFYIFMTFILLAMNVYFVLIPLNRLRVEYGFSIREKKESSKKKRELIQFLSGPEENKKNLEKIKLYLIREILISILPLLAVLCIRFYLGRPEDIAYNFTNLTIIIALFTVWFGYNSNACIKFKRMITPYVPSMQKKLRDKINHPAALFAMLNFSNMSRGTINRLSKMKIPTYVETKEINLKPMNLIDREKKVDSKAIMENLSAIGGRVADEVTNLAIKGKEVTKSGMSFANEQINTYISKKVETWTNQDSRWISSLIQVINVIIPVVLIYVFSKIW